MGLIWKGWGQGGHLGPALRGEQAWGQGWGEAAHPEGPHAAPSPAGKVPGDDCPLVWGQCSHCFHMHCILKWLHAQQVQQYCPMCRQEWKFKE